jgi:hypothetical protein
MTMCAVYWYRSYASRPFGEEAGDLESLLHQHEHNYNGYGALGGSELLKKPSTQSASTKGGWIDYFIGFSILFPYLW